ncbi:hypothetical protein KY284_010641 [Solanum tuberosum]|nr:hypothetical protein KY284_010641 [Solanum tuberosum]
MFKLTTLSFAIQQARMQEKAIEVALKKSNVATKASGNNVSASSSMVTAPGSVNASPKPAPPRLSSEVYEHRKANQLCFRCDEKYGLGHRCKIRQLQCISGSPEELPVIQEVPPEIEIEVAGEWSSEITVAQCLATGMGQFEDREAVVTTNSACVLAMSAMVPTWVQEVSKSYEEDPEVCLNF